MNLEVLEIPEDEAPAKAHQMTLEAMREGVEIISQAVFLMDSWFGRLDILRKVDKASSLGDYSYEVIDTKLVEKQKQVPYYSSHSTLRCSRSSRDKLPRICMLLLLASPLMKRNTVSRI